MFTTKPIGTDRKLFKTIDKHLKQILEDNELSKSIEKERKQSLSSIFGGSASPLHSSYNGRLQIASTRRGSNSSLVSDGGELDASETPASFRSSHETSEDVIFNGESPFGSLKEASTRKVFAYLIAILNTTYPDHDFSNLQPSTENFRKVKSVDDLRHRFNNVMMSLGKREDILSWIWDTINVYMEILPTRQSFSGDHTSHLRQRLPSNAGQSFVADNQPDEQGCKVYEFQPSDQSILEDLHYPYQMMWSNYWFIYNKKKKRVCFLYLTAINKVHFAQITRTRSPFNDNESKDLLETRKESLISTDEEFMEDVDRVVTDEEFESMQCDDIIGGMEL